jgi:hypothetical protein
MVTRANSARKRLISICSAVTFDRLSAPFSVPSRCPLTQLNKVCSTSPNVRDAAAILWPDSTSRTASCLNASVYRARVALIIGSPSLIVSYGIHLAGARSNSTCDLALRASLKQPHRGSLDPWQLWTRPSYSVGLSHLTRCSALHRSRRVRIPSWEQF